MARRRVAVHPDGFPKMLLAILVEAFGNARDIVVVQPGPADIAIVSAAMVDSARHAISAPLVIEIASNGRAVTVIRPGKPPAHYGDFSGDLLLNLVRSETRRGFWCRLFSGPAPTLPPPATPQSTPGSAVDGYFAHLATKIAAGCGDVRESGPRRDLARLADTVAAPAANPTAPPSLARLQTTFNLTDAERDLLFLASLVEVDPVAARIVGLLNDHLLRTRPTIGLLSALGHVPQSVAAGFTDGAIHRFALATLDGDEPLITRPVRVHPDVWPLILGLDRRPPFEADEPMQDTDLALSDDQRAAMGRVADAIAEQDPETVLVVVAGDPDVGRAAIAARLARQLCGTSLVVPAARLGEDQALQALARETRLQRAAVTLTEADDLDPALWRRAMTTLATPVFVTARPGSVGKLTLDIDRPVTQLQAPRRDTAHRLRMWRAAASDWPEDGLAVLSERFDFGRSRIRSAVALTRATATATGAKPDLRTACETLRDTRFDGLAERLDCPFASDDIILRPDTRAELDLATAWARHGTRIFGAGGEAAQLHTGAGLACLFAGPPGVGKTMAARIIAAQVDYALYRIDLSQVVDKFIGESEKRLSALFDEAERSRVALFFDEADALFGKRTEVRDSHDRYANITVDHLLQRIDDFDGLAILATNLAGNLDDAFMRRVRVRADFQAPDADDRRRIWQKLLGPVCTDAIDLATLADPFELVGGEIRNAVYTAHLYAADARRPVGMEDCVRGLWRELRKVGRVVDVAHLGPWRSVI